MFSSVPIGEHLDANPQIYGDPTISCVLVDELDLDSSSRLKASSTSKPSMDVDRAGCLGGMASARYTTDE
jgi:hypothetical protein